MHDTSWSRLCVFTQFGTESYIKNKVHATQCELNNSWCTIGFARFTSLRLFVELYQLFKGLEIDVLINVELSILVLLDAIMTHFVVVPACMIKQMCSMLASFPGSSDSLKLTIMTMHTCFPQKMRVSPENFLLSPVIQCKLLRRESTPWATTI